MPGKRPRQIRRTTSMSQLGSSTPQSRLVVPSQKGAPTDDESMSIAAMDMSSGSGKCTEESAQNNDMAMDVAEDHAAGRSAVVDQMPYAKATGPTGFLEFCFLCRRRLGHGKDIFMYRGDRAFCSIECRCHQIAMDERRERCRITAVKKGTAAPPANTNGSNQKVVPAETAAAA